MEIEWDEDKAASNLLKHGLSFSLAEFFFDDPNGFERVDIDSDELEIRWSLIALVSGQESVLISYALSH